MQNTHFKATWWNCKSLAWTASFFFLIRFPEMQMAGVLICMCCTNSILWGGAVLTKWLQSWNRCGIYWYSTRGTVTGNPDQRGMWAPEFLSVFITTTQLCQTLRPKVNGVSRGIHANQMVGASEAEPSHLKDVLTKVKLSLTSHWVCTNSKINF